MYQSIFYDQMTQQIHLWDDEEGYMKVKFQKYGYKLDKNGTDTTIDDKKVTKVTKWSPSEVSQGLIYEADIPPTTRVLVDLYKESDIPSKNCNIGFWDIETEIGKGFPQWKNPIQKITAVAFMDKSLNQHYVFILDEKKELEYREYSNVKIIPCHTEKEVMMKFLTAYEAAEIHILSDWNGYKFDVPYFYNRTLRVLGEEWANKLSPIGKVYFDEFNQRYVIGGVAHLDYLELYKKLSNGERTNYRLGTIGKLEVNIGKIEYTGTLDTLYRDDIEKFIQYNLNDNYILEALEKKLKYIETARNVCHECHVQYEDILKSTRFIDGAILTYIKRNNLVAPSKPVTITGRSLGKKVKAKGAFVKEPVPGRYRYLVDYDATSLYPSIIRSLNISPDTKMFQVISAIDLSLENLKDGTIYTVQIANNTSRELTGEQIRKAIEKNDLTFSCNSTAYMKSKRGIIPQVLDVWFAKRKEFSKIADEFYTAGDMEQYEFYDSRQMLQKILINSIYGCLLESGFRYYDKANGESVTKTGKGILLFGEKVVNKFIADMVKKEAAYVIYCDTDSLFIKLQEVLEFEGYDLDDIDSCKKRILELVPIIYRHLNDSYNIYCKDAMNMDDHFIEFKQEYIIKAGMWVKKKNYIMHLINKKGKDIDKVDIKGLSVVRSSFAPAFKDTMKRCLIDMLNYVDKKKIEVYLREFKISMQDKPFEEIANPTSLKEISKYTIPGAYKFPPKTPAHVKAGLQYNWFIQHNGLGNDYAEIVDGDKIKWVYLQNNPNGFVSLGLKGFEDPPELVEYVKTYMDYSKTYDNSFISKIQKLYDVLDWGTINLNKNKLRWVAA